MHLATFFFFFLAVCNPIIIKDQRPPVKKCWSSVSLSAQKPKTPGHEASLTVNITITWTEATTVFFMSVRMLSRVLRDWLHCDGESGHSAVHSSWPHLVRLHVFLHIGFLGEGTATYDALEWLLARMTAAQRGENSPQSSLWNFSLGLDFNSGNMIDTYCTFQGKPRCPSSAVQAKCFWSCRKWNWQRSGFFFLNIKKIHGVQLNL